MGERWEEIHEECVKQSMRGNGPDDRMAYSRIACQRIAELEAELKTKQDALNHWSKEAQEQTYRANQLEDSAASLRAERDEARREAIKLRGGDKKHPTSIVGRAYHLGVVATLEAERDEAMRERDEAVALLRKLKAGIDDAAETVQLQINGDEDPGSYLRYEDFAEVDREAEAFLARYDEPSDGGAGS